MRVFDTVLGLKGFDLGTGKYLASVPRFILSGALAFVLSFPAGAQVRYPRSHPDTPSLFRAIRRAPSGNSVTSGGMRPDGCEPLPATRSGSGHAFFARGLTSSRTTRAHSRHAPDHSRARRRSPGAPAGAVRTTSAQRGRSTEVGRRLQAGLKSGSMIGGALGSRVIYLYRAHSGARVPRSELKLTAGDPPLLHGEGGFSHRGKRAGRGELLLQPAQSFRSWKRQRTGGDRHGMARPRMVSSYLAPEAAGWDWVGINASPVVEGTDGFPHAQQGQQCDLLRWHSGAPRRLAHQLQPRGCIDRTCAPLALTTALDTGISSRAACAVDAGKLFRVEPLIDDQELDSRASTGTSYWEGAVRLIDESTGSEAGQRLPRAPGYWRPMKL